MTPPRTTGPQAGTGRSLWRPFLLGAAAGFLGTLPVVDLALLVPLGEVVAPLLLPGVHVLPAVLGEAPVTWPGWVTLLLACTANALAWGVLVAGLVALAGSAPLTGVGGGARGTARGALRPCPSGYRPSTAICASG